MPEMLQVSPFGLVHTLCACPQFTKINQKRSLQYELSTRGGSLEATIFHQLQIMVEDVVYQQVECTLYKANTTNKIIVTFSGPHTSCLVDFFLLSNMRMLAIMGRAGNFCTPLHQPQKSFSGHTQFLEHFNKLERDAGCAFSYHTHSQRQALMTAQSCVFSSRSILLPNGECVNVFLSVSSIIIITMEAPLCTRPSPKGLEQVLSHNYCCQRVSGYAQG